MQGNVELHIKPKKDQIERGSTSVFPSLTERDPMQLFRAILNQIVYETGADGKIIEQRAAA